METACARRNAVALYDLTERRRPIRFAGESEPERAPGPPLPTQVWAVGEDRGLYFRMGVTPSEPSGSGWIPVSAQWGTSKGPDPPRWVRAVGPLPEAARPELTRVSGTGASAPTLVT